MGDFRKKPVVVKGLRWTGDNTAEISLFTGRAIVLDMDDRYPHDDIINLGSGRLSIPTLEGRMVASKGDWIIKGVNGEFYPCKPDIFEKTYEPA